MSSSKLSKVCLKRCVNNSNSTQQMSTDLQIAHRLGGWEQGWDWIWLCVCCFFLLPFFQVIRQAKLFCTLATKLTKHYIATWPSVRIEWLLFSVMLLWVFCFPKLVFHIPYVTRKAIFSLMHFSGKPVDKFHMLTAKIATVAIWLWRVTVIFYTLFEFLLRQLPFFFPSMSGTANLCSYIFQESDCVCLQPGCLANSFMLTQVHSHLSCAPLQLAYANVSGSLLLLVF